MTVSGTNKSRALARRQSRLTVSIPAGRHEINVDLIQLFAKDASHITSALHVRRDGVMLQGTLPEVSVAAPAAGRGAVRGDAASSVVVGIPP